MYARKASAIPERIRADPGDAVSNCHARKASAKRERLFSDACDAIANSHARKPRATIERSVTNLAACDCYTLKACRDVVYRIR